MVSCPIDLFIEPDEDLKEVFPNANRISGVLLVVEGDLETIATVESAVNSQTPVVVSSLFDLGPMTLVIWLGMPFP